MSKRFDITPYLDDVVECLERGESLRMISIKIGVGHCTLSKALKERGIKTPSKNESARNVWKNHTHPMLGKKGSECHHYGKKKSEKWYKSMLSVWRDTADKMRIYRKKHSSGYILVYAPEHPSADRSGYVLEHRIVMENHIGRILLDTEIVHHINEKKDDNRIENLEIVSRAEHAKIHNNLERI